MRALGIMALGACLALSACEGDATVIQINPADVFTPASLDFGARRIAVIHELTTVLVMNEPLTVADVRFEPALGAFTARTSGGNTLRGIALRPNVPVEVVVQFRPNESIDYGSSMVVVFQDGRTVALPLLAQGRTSSGDELIVSPSELVFPESEVGGDAILPVLLENQTPDPITLGPVLGMRSTPLAASDVFHVTRSGGGALIGHTIAPGASLTVELHFRPKGLGTVTEKLRFYVEGADLAAAEITAQGTGLPAGDVSCQPLSLDFGDIVRGMAHERTATCTVIGGVYTVSLAEIERSSSSLFSLMSAPSPGTVLAAGETFTLRARFDAEGEPVPHQGTVRIVSGQGRTRVLSLGGAVVRPPIGDVDLSVALTWDRSALDLDLHLVRNGAVNAPFDPINDTFYRRKTQDWGSSDTTVDDPVLDRDATGLGPEEINLQQAAETRYDVYVHYFKPTDVATTATVTVAFRGVPGGSVTRRIERCGDLWHVGYVAFVGGVPTFNAVDAMASARARGECQ